MQTTNPVLEITQLLKDLTEVKIIGFCHGYAHVFNVTKTIGTEPDRLQWQVAGVNHAIWLNKFDYDGKDGYEIVEKWIKKSSDKWEPKDPWDTDLSLAALDMYRFCGMLTVGDTTRCETWKYHYNLATKKKWYGKFGGIDNEIERPRFYQQLRRTRKELLEFAKRLKEDPSIMLTQIMPTAFTRNPQSKEQHIPFINAVVNNEKTRLVLNVENNGIIKDIPNDVVIEMPVTVDKNGIRPEEIKPNLNERIKQMYLMPRILKMRWTLEAFKTADLIVVKEILVRDPRTKSFRQVQEVLRDILDLPFNKEMKDHYLKN